MPSYDLAADVTEWLDELGGAENAAPYLSELADRFAKAGEANKAYYYRKLAAEMRKIINSPPPAIVRKRINA